MKKSKITTIGIIATLASVGLSGCVPAFQRPNKTEQSSKKKSSKTKLTKAQKDALAKKQQKQVYKNSTTYHYLTMPQAMLLINQQQSFSAIAVDPDTKIEYFVVGALNSSTNTYSQSMTMRRTSNGQPMTYQKSIKKLAEGKN